MPGSAHVVSVGSGSQNKETDHTVTEACLASAHSEKQMQRRKRSHVPMFLPLIVPTRDRPLADTTMPCSTLTLFHILLQEAQRRTCPLSQVRPLSTRKESHHLGPQREMPTTGTVPQTTSHLCSWAGCRSTSHLTGRTSVVSPPAPEGAGRRRRRMTGRRSRGPLSSPGPGPQDLRRTQLGAQGRKAGPRCFPEPSV